MKTPFAKVKVGDAFVFQGTLCRKTDRSRFMELEGAYTGSTRYLSHDEEFHEVEIAELLERGAQTYAGVEYSEITVDESLEVQK